MAKNWWEGDQEVSAAPAPGNWWEKDAQVDEPSAASQIGSTVKDAWGIGSGNTVRGAGEFLQAPVENTASAMANLAAVGQHGAPDETAPDVDPMGNQVGTSSDTAPMTAEQAAERRITLERARIAADEAQRARDKARADVTALGTVGGALEDAGKSAQQHYSEQLAADAPMAVRGQQNVQDANGFLGTSAEILKPKNWLGDLATAVQSAPDMAIGAGAGSIAGKVVSVAARAAAEKAATSAFQETLLKAASDPATLGNARQLAQDAARQAYADTISSAAEHAATSVGNLAEGVQSGFSTRAQLQDQVAQMPEDQLQQNSPRYRELIAQGMDSATARRMLGAELGDQAAPLATLWTIGAGRLSGAAEAEGHALTATGRPSMRTTLQNIGKEGLEETMQNPGEDFAGYQARSEIDPNQAPFDAGGSMAQGLFPGLGLGAAMHGTAHVSQAFSAQPPSATLAGRPISTYSDDELKGYAKSGVLTSSVQAKVDAELERRAAASAASTSDVGASGAADAPNALDNAVQNFAEKAGIAGDDASTPPPPGVTPPAPAAVPSGDVIPQPVTTQSVLAGLERPPGEQPAAAAPAEQPAAQQPAPGLPVADDPLGNLAAANAVQRRAGVRLVVADHGSSATSGVSHLESARARNDAALVVGRAALQKISGDVPDLQPIQDRGLFRRASAVADAIESVTGSRPVLYHDPKGGSDGFEHNGVSYVNAGNLESSLQHTIFHETYHVAEARARQGDVSAQQFVKTAETLFDMMSPEGKVRYAQRYLFKREIAAGTMTPDEALAHPKLKSEMVADFFGRRGDDVGFMNRLAERAPEHFGGFARRWIDALTRTIDALRGKRIDGENYKDVDQYIKKLSAAKATAASALINWRRANPRLAAQLPAVGSTVEQRAAAAPIDTAAHEAAESPLNERPIPTNAQVEANNAKLGHDKTTFPGLNISFENPAGSERFDRNNTPPRWRSRLQHHYGYIKGTVGKDKDHVDVFVKPGTPKGHTGTVYVVDQRKGNGHFDEHKAMLGFASEREAEQAYLSNYPKGWTGMESITPMSYEDFKAWVRDPELTKQRAADAAPALAFSKKQGGSLSPHELDIQARLHSKLNGDFEAAEQEYNRLKQTDGGRILNTDDARELSPDYLADRTQSAAVHEPASNFVKALYAKRLTEPPGPHQAPVVLFTAGGTGGGKTTAVREQPIVHGMSEQAQIVYDTNMNAYASSKAKIEQALAAGKVVRIVLVVRDPVDALVNGALTRAERQRREFGSGRTVPLAEHIKTHVGAVQTISRLEKEYRGDPRVKFIIIDNSHGRGSSKVRSIDWLNSLRYNDVESRVAQALEKEHAEGRISDETYRGFAGQAAPHAGNAGESRSVRPGPRPVDGQGAEQRGVERGSGLGEEGPGSGEVGGAGAPGISFSAKQRAIESWATRAMGGENMGSVPVLPITEGAPHPAFTMMGAGSHQPFVLDVGHARHIANTHPDITPQLIAELPELLKNPRAIYSAKPGRITAIIDRRDGSGNPVAAAFQKGEVIRGRQTMKLVELRTIFGLDDSLKELLDVARMKTGAVWLPSEEVSRVEGLLAAGSIRRLPGDQPVPSLPRPTSLSGGVATPRSLQPLTTSASVLSDAALGKFNSSSPKGWEQLKTTIQIPAGAKLDGLSFSKKPSGNFQQVKVGGKVTSVTPNGHLQADVPEMGKVGQARRVVQDQHIRMRDLREWAEEHGAHQSATSDVYGAEERMHGRIATRVEDFRNKVIKPLVEATQKAGFTMEQLAEVLHAEHAEERNKQVAKINDQMPDGGSGMMTADANAILAKASPRLRALAAQWQAITTRSRDILLRAGIISKDQADAWDAAYKHYVPLKGGDEADAAKRAGIGKGLSVNGKNKRALGHSEREERIVENILRDHERAITLAEKNRVGQAMMLWLSELGDERIGTVDQPKKRAALMPGFQYDVRGAGLSVATFDSEADAHKFILRQVALNSPGATRLRVFKSAADPSVQYRASPMLEENEAQVYVAGHAVRMQLNDPDLARAYKRLNADQMGRLISMSRAINTYLSRAYTGYNPAFIPRNLIRDFGSGVVKLTGNFGAKTVAGVLARYPRALASLLRHSYSGKSTQSIDMYRANGGSTGAAWLGDLERVGTNVQREYEKFVGVMALAKSGRKAAAARVAAGKVIGGLAGWIEHLNAATENAMRLATFEQILDETKSPEQAASAAKNSTVNFNRKGEMGPTLGALWLFFNPNVQDTASVLETLTRGKHKLQAHALVGAMMGLAYTLAALQFGGSDDDYERWKKIPDSVRDKNLVLRTGKDSYITIPVPFGFGFFHTLGNSIFALQHGESLHKVVVNMASNAFDHFSPIGNPIQAATGSGNDHPAMSALAAITPGIPGTGELGRDLYRAADNHNAFGGDIVPDSKFDQGRPNFLRMFRSTKGTSYDAAARFMSDLTGGTDTQGGAIDVSPETLKFWAAALTGGTGTFLSDLTHLAGLGVRAGMSGDDTDNAALAPELREIPILRDYARTEQVTDSRRAFWDAAADAKSALADFKRAAKKGDDAGMASVQDQNAELLGLGRATLSIGKTIKAMRDRVDEINADPDSSLAYKRAAVKQLEREEAEIYDDYLHAVTQAQSEARERRASSR